MPYFDPMGVFERLKAPGEPWRSLAFGALLLAVAVASPCAHAQATFTSGPTDATLLSTLQGPGVVLSNATTEARDRASQIGVFSNGIAGANPGFISIKSLQRNMLWWVGDPWVGSTAGRSGPAP